jgi:large subunit ribosomal protein L25
MRKDITIAASVRDSRGKNEARRLRAAGNIPAVVYGAGGAAVAVAVSPKEINKVLHSSTGHNTIFDVAVGEEKSPVMVVDWLHDPVKGNLLHVDLMRIDLTKKLHVKVPVHFHGEPVGVKIEGGVFEVITREVHVVCLPNDIPEFFDVDIAAMHIGNNIRAGDLKLPEGVSLRGHADAVLAHVIATRASEETKPAEGDAAAAKAEPEVVKKGKKEEAGAEEKPKKK